MTISVWEGRSMTAQRAEDGYRCQCCGSVCDVTDFLPGDDMRIMRCPNKACAPRGDCVDVATSAARRGER